LNGDEKVFGSGQHFQIPVVATWILGLNTRLKPFDDKSVRAQFKAAISSADFVENLYPGQMPAAGGYIPPGLPGYLPGASTPVKPAAGEHKVHTLIHIAVPKLLAKADAIKEYLERKLRAHGFNVKVDLLDWEDEEAGYNAKKLQTFLMSMNADYPDPEFLVRNFESSNPDNFSGIRSAKIDRLIKVARETDSRSERWRIYESLGQELNNEALTVNLLHYRAHYWFAPCVHGIELNSLGDVYIPYRKIYLEGDCRVASSKGMNAQK